MNDHYFDEHFYNLMMTFGAPSALAVIRGSVDDLVACAWKLQQLGRARPAAWLPDALPSEGELYLVVIATSTGWALHPTRRPDGPSLQGPKVPIEAAAFLEDPDPFLTLIDLA